MQLLWRQVVEDCAQKIPPQFSSSPALWPPGPRPETRPVRNKSSLRFCALAPAIRGLPFTHLSSELCRITAINSQHAVFVVLGSRLPTSKLLVPIYCLVGTRQHAMRTQHSTTAPNCGLEKACRQWLGHRSTAPRTTPFWSRGTGCVYAVMGTLCRANQQANVKAGRLTSEQINAAQSRVLRRVLVAEGKTCLEGMQ